MDPTKSFATRPGYSPRAAFAAVLWILAAALPARAQLQSTVFRFDPAPPPGSTYIALDRAVAGDAPGQAVAFHAKIRSPATGGVDGVFIADPVAAGSTVALRNEQAAPAAPFRRLARPTINATGDVAFSARLVNGTEGVFRSGPIPVALSGEAALTLASGTLDDFDLPFITDDGQVVFHAGVFGGPMVGPITVDSAIFRCFGGDGNCSTGTGTLEALVAEGALVPDRPGRSICDLFPGVSASNYGIAFKAETKLDCANGAEPPLVGIFRLPHGGSIATVALQGEAAQPSPGMAGTVYDTFSEDVPIINNLGAITFLAKVTGVFITSSVYACDPGTCPAAPAAIAVSNGDLDVDNDVLSSFSAPHISDTGDISLRADARGVSHATGVFIWHSASDVVEKIAVKGGAAPDPMEVFRRIERPWMSPGGRIAFRAITKSTAGGPLRRGLFLFE